MANHIPEGYKQTEVGIFPEDWVEKRIGDIFNFKNGLNKGKEYFGYGIPIINYMDVYKNSSLLCKNLRGRVSLNKNEIETYKVNKGDVFFTRTSETVEEIGISAVLLEDSSDTVFSGFLLRARPRNQLLDLEFCKFCFSHKQIRRQILQKASFTTRALTNGKLLSRVILLIPPTKTEQKAIATALSDVDNLITSLEQLIEKKKAIKQGTMQELLTGKRRLKGFGEGKGYKQTELGLIPEDWEVVNLHQVCVQIKERIFPTQLFTESKSIELEHLSQGTGRLLAYTSSKMVRSQKTIFSKGDVLFGKLRPYLRKYYYATFSGICSTEIWVLRSLERIISKYLYYLIQTERFIQVANQSEGTKMPRADWKIIKNLDIQIPTIQAEQHAITHALTDMDSEIEILEAKVNKYKQIKQGMMQNLLTGRIRLV